MIVRRIPGSDGRVSQQRRPEQGPLAADGVGGFIVVVVATQAHAKGHGGDAMAVGPEVHRAPLLDGEGHKGVGGRGSGGRRGSGSQVVGTEGGTQGSIRKVGRHGSEGKGVPPGASAIDVGGVQDDLLVARQRAHHAIHQVGRGGIGVEVLSVTIVVIAVREDDEKVAHAGGGGIAPGLHRFEDVVGVVELGQRVGNRVGQGRAVARLERRDPLHVGDRVPAGGIDAIRWQVVQQLPARVFPDLGGGGDPRGGVQGGGRVVVDRGSIRRGGFRGGVQEAEGPQDGGLVLDPGLDGRPLDGLDPGHPGQDVRRGILQALALVDPGVIVFGHHQKVALGRRAPALAPAHIALPTRQVGIGGVVDDVLGG